MKTGFRFRCYPSAAQEQTLLRWIGCQRFVYNAKVREDRYFRAFARQSLQHVGQFAPQDQQYAQFIGEDTAWLREVPSVVLRNGAVRWKQAYGRFFKKLAGRPTLQRKPCAQSVWVTSELFQFDAVTDAATGAVQHRLILGTKKFPVGEVAFKVSGSFKVPASIHLTVEAGRWFVSVSFDDGATAPTFQETADWLAKFERQELLERAVGVDRGVAIPAMASTGHAFDFSDAQKRRTEKKAAAIRRWQRKLSRRAKGGANLRKAARRVEALHQYSKNMRRDFAHQTSHVLVSDPSTLLIVFEDLGVQRMTRRARPKQDEHGRHVRNGAAAKSGLNAAILRSAWGQTREFSTYKALRAGKLCLCVPAQHTSQECAACGHIHPDNRPSQAAFVCQRCGHQDNADHNAGRVIAHRGVDRVLSGQYKDKDRKRTMRLRQKSLGPERSEVTPTETTVSLDYSNAVQHGSVKWETPATTPCV
ncbi:transposase [Thiomonas sp. X19]|uniref:RNA-guided endonuclease InsQ/TnpB family protein n=1 Tax=Thiomonas sp. X19 TaxID=1050370 RepID=UPI000B6C7183|nr:RNA-guided endonuclease TnpB family protein [Thiomonas sp. X19]SCC93020.1 transposase [Thiomonas sp. X19]